MADHDDDGGRPRERQAGFQDAALSAVDAHRAAREAVADVFGRALAARYGKPAAGQDNEQEEER